jgi:glyoxylase-like metal-dependent hydrolase (beta-lactamase superfamily II)
MNIVNVGYDSTNYFVLANTRSKLLIDVGWSGTLPKLQHQCKRVGISLPDVKHLLCTHYHPDHAGLAQELKRIGLKLILLENQISAVPVLRTYMKPEHNYVEIDLTDNIVLKIEDSRAFLEKLGIQGEIIATPGHSEDSVTLILDEGAAFTGDLTHPILLTEDSTAARESWNKIRALGVKTIYPGHGPTWRLEA